MLRTLLYKSQPSRFYSTSSVKQITSNQLVGWLNEKKLYSDLIVIDVRERKEIEQKGKIKGALNIPLSPKLFSAALSDINKDATVNKLKRKRNRIEYFNRLCFIVNQVVEVMKQLFWQGSWVMRIALV
jgi:hypothetical protein